MQTFNLSANIENGFAKGMKIVHTKLMEKKMGDSLL